jgi:hypothetical protein
MDMTSIDCPKISVFDCKCALLRNFGADIPIKEIGFVLESKCNWLKGSGGVTNEQYALLEKYYSNALVPLQCHYSMLDVRHKGWITEPDVYRVSSHEI